MAFIIGAFNKYDMWDRTHSVYKFSINDMQYAVYEVDMCWGLPALKFQVGQEDVPDSYFIWESEEEAREYIKELKSLNR